MKIPSEAELVKMRFQSLTLRLGRHAIHHMELNLDFDDDKFWGKMYLECNMRNSTGANNHAESQNQCWDMKGRWLRWYACPIRRMPLTFQNRECRKFVRMDVVHTRPARIIARRLAPRFLGSSFFFAGKRTGFSRLIAGRQHSDVLRNFTCERKIWNS